jgi:hypothetical protein
MLARRWFRIECVIQNQHSVRLTATATSSHSLSRGVCVPVGLSPGRLAAAIAVPTGVALLVGSLVAACCLRRRRRRNQQAPPGAGRNKQLTPAAARDLEAGDTVVDGFGDVQRDSWRDQVGCPARG